MTDDEICTIVIHRAAGERTERVRMEVREGQELITLVALEAIRRRMTGNSPRSFDPIFEDDEEAIG